MCARNHYAHQTYDMSKYACTCEKSIVVNCEMMMRVGRSIEKALDDRHTKFCWFQELVKHFWSVHKLCCHLKLGPGE